MYKKVCKKSENLPHSIFVLLNNFVFARDVISINNNDILEYR